VVVIYGLKFLHRRSIVFGHTKVSLLIVYFLRNMDNIVDRMFVYTMFSTFECLKLSQPKAKKWIRAKI